MDINELNKLVFFASFLSAKEQTLGFIYKQSYKADFAEDIARAAVPS